MKIYIPLFICLFVLVSCGGHKNIDNDQKNNLLPETQIEDINNNVQDIDTPVGTQSNTGVLNLDDPEYLDTGSGETAPVLDIDDPEYNDLTPVEVDSSQDSVVTASEPEADATVAQPELMTDESSFPEADPTANEAELMTDESKFPEADPTKQ